MNTNFYYIYAIKDPRTSPAKPFYIGKGTGSRAYDHLISADSTRKYSRIREIIAHGAKPFIEILADDLTDQQALKLEAEMIAALGTIESGGLLTNSVIPSGISRKRTVLVLPTGCLERAQLGLAFLKAAIHDLARANHEGITNSEAASVLGLRSDYRGKQKDYLSYSVLGLLLRERKVSREATARRHRCVN
jgi:hypothetical protein